jgi:hypothetical protein
MIRFLISRGHGYTLECLRKTPQAPTVSLIAFNRLLRPNWLRRATYAVTGCRFDSCTVQDTISLEVVITPHLVGRRPLMWECGDRRLSGWNAYT